LIRLNQKANLVSAAWFNDSWSYRQAINISSHTAGETNVYIITTITIGSTAKAQADDGDFRFTNQTGTLLPYYISSGAGTTAVTFHVQLADFPAGPETVYAYYGNPSAPNGFNASDYSTQASNYSIGSYSSEEVGGGPVAYWKFDEGQDNTCTGGVNDVCDSTQNQYDGANTGISWRTEDQCISGKCLYLSGTATSWSNLNTKAMNGLSNFTVGYWMKSSDTTKTGTAIHATNTGNNEFIAFDYRNFTIYVKDSAWTTGIALNDGKWHFINITRNGTSGGIQLFVDGISRGSNTLTSGTLTVNCLVLGQEEDGVCSGFDAGQAFLGILDEVKIYPYIRSQAQINQDYNSGLSGQKAAKGADVAFGSSSSGKSLSDGLVGYWKLDEGVGTTSADSSGNNTATFGAGSSAPSWAAGKFGIGLSFGGTDNQNIYVTDTTILEPPTALTLSTWIKLGSTGTRQIFLGKGDGSADNSTQYWMELTAANQLRFYLSTGSSGTNLIATDKTITDTTYWHHIAMIWDGSYMRVYLDGSQSSIVTPMAGTLTNTAKNFAIGKLGEWGSGNFNGLIDEVRVYNRALSPSEITSLYEWAPGPVGDWRLDEGVGTSAFDSSGYGNNGVLGSGSSAPIWSTGKHGKGLNFDGTNDNVGNITADGNNLDITNSLTIEAWVKPSSLTGFPTIVGKWNSDKQFKLAASLNGDGKPYIDVSSNGSDDIYQQTSQAITTTDWNHITGIYIGGSSPSLKMYINGVLSTGTSGGTVPSSLYTATGPIVIGMEGNNKFSGLIDEVKIYNYARSQKQILTDMNAGNPMSSSRSTIAHWKFDEGYNTVVNNYGNGGIGLSGSFGAGNSAPAWTTDSRSGKSLSFDGTYDYVSIPNNVSLKPSVFSISVWIKPASYGENNYGRIVDIPSGMTLMLSQPTQSVFFSAGQAQPPGSNTIALNQWSHVVGTYDGNNATVYVNGVLQSSWQQGALTSNNNPLVIGNLGANGTRHFNGLIDEVKIYNYVLTANDVKQDYNNSATSKIGTSNQTIGGTTTSLQYCVPGDTSTCSTPIVEWKFDEGIGSTIFDSSGLNHNAGFTSGIWGSGKFGKGLTVNSNVATTSSADLSSNSMTLNYWFKWNVAGSSWPRIGKFNSANADANNEYSFQYKQDDGRWYIRFNNSGTLYAQGNGQSLDTAVGRWHFISITYDNPTGKLRIIQNGSRVLLDVVNSFTMTPTSYDFVATNGASNQINLDQIQYYNYARSPAQIALDYNRGAPIGWWKMDECQGAVIGDWSGNGRNGTLNIGASGSQNSIGTCNIGTSAAWTNGAVGKINSAISLDGNDDFIQSGTNPITGSNPFTLAAWMKVGSHSTYGLGFYIGDAAAGQSAWLGWTASTSIGSSNSIGGGLYGTNYGSGITDTNWHHVILSFAGGTNGATKFYVDGIQKVSSTTTPNLASTSIMMGKANSGTSYWYNGLIDDVRIYNYALNPTQINTLYNGSAVNFR
jgi:hypothetical protein